jgi:hypothetical protein
MTHSSSECSLQELETMRKAAERGGRNWDDYFDVEEVNPPRKKESTTQDSSEKPAEKPQATRKNRNTSK